MRNSAFFGVNATLKRSNFALQRVILRLFAQVFIGSITARAVIFHGRVSE